MQKPVAFFIALGLFAAANFAVGCFSSTYSPDIQHGVFAWAEDDSHVKPWSWWLARKWFEQAASPDVVLFGSSQMGSALVAADAKHRFEVVDALTHRRAWTLETELSKRLGSAMNVFSLASPGAMCSDAFMASNALFTNELRPKLVVIGVSPRDFIDNTMQYPASTEPFKFYSRYVSPGKLLIHSYHGPMAWLQYGLESLPFRKLGEYIQSNISLGGEAGSEKNEATQTVLAAAIGGGEAVPGKWRVPAVIPPIWADNTKEYKTRYKNPSPPVYKAEKAFFNRFLASMESAGIPVLVIGMPSLPMNRELLPAQFWNDFRAYIGSTCTLHGADWLDLSDADQFDKQDYLDTVHLNASGGQKLFAVIAEHISKESRLCNALTGEATTRGVARNVQHSRQTRLQTASKSEPALR